MSDGKESDKNHTIENVVTILAVSTMMFFLMILPSYAGNSKWYCPCKTNNCPNKYCTQKNVKRSVTNICHPPESPWYSRTKHYKLQTMKACLDAEGRLPELLKSNCDDTSRSDDTSGSLEKAVKEIERQGQAEEALGFLISPGIILGFGERPSDISIDDTTTIIEHSRSRMQMRMALEVHWFWDYGWEFASDYLYGHGPFLAGAFINGGSLVNPVEHLGIGYMIGLKFGENQKLNLGVGVFHNTKTEVLRDQYSNGQDVTGLGLERNDIVREDDDTALMLIISAIPLSIN